MSLTCKDNRAYLLLTAIVISGLASSLITAPKIVHIGVDFPFSNIIFSLLTYPIIDCICEVWGKSVARQTLWIALIAQTLIAAMIQLSIMSPHAAFWSMQDAYAYILSAGTKVVLASLLAFSVSQLLDISIYQKIKDLSKGKHLWLRSNAATYIGQTLDSIIFVNIVFYGNSQVGHIILGSILVKIILSCLMTPGVYLVIYLTRKYLEQNTHPVSNQSILRAQAASATIK